MNFIGKINHEIKEAKKRLENNAIRSSQYHYDDGFLDGLVEAKRIYEEWNESRSLPTKEVGMPGCKACDTEIIWIKTSKNKNMPIDKKPIKVYQFDTTIKRWLLMDGHQPHWATCPEADKF